MYIYVYIHRVALLRGLALPPLAVGLRLALEDELRGRDPLLEAVAEGPANLVQLRLGVVGEHLARLPSLPLRGGVQEVDAPRGQRRVEVLDRLLEGGDLPRARAAQWARGAELLAEAQAGLDPRDAAPRGLGVRGGRRASQGGHRASQLVLGRRGRVALRDVVALAEPRRRQVTALQRLVNGLVDDRREVPRRLAQPRAHRRRRRDRASVGREVRVPQPHWRRHGPAAHGQRPAAPRTTVDEEGAATAARGGLV